jgi:cytochrome c oxidase cbb3-type subunit 3
LVGPNLTDEYYKNVKQLIDVARVIQEGAANGSMPAWKSRLHPNEIVMVAAYVANLRGKNLKGPRGQEGQAIPPWPAAPQQGQPTGTPTAVTSGSPRV